MTRALRVLAFALCGSLCGTLLAQPSVGPVPPSEAGTVRKSRLLLLPAAMVERSAASQYAQLLQAARGKNALNPDAAELERLRRIARELIPHASRFNPDAGRWRWQVNLIGADTVNAFCMPGGKIAFYSGLLRRLKLTDDEVAAVMGHEIAHALLEHGRARMSEQLLKQLGITAIDVFFNLSDLSMAVLGQAAHLALTLPYARQQETDSDLAGMELMARAGRDPRAAPRVWEKMAALKSGGAQPPPFLSTHPSHASRIQELRAALPGVVPLYDAARTAGTR